MPVLIVLEGGDQAGKATQARMLADALARAGLGVETLEFPDYATPIGRQIESLLKGPAEPGGGGTLSPPPPPQPPQVLHLLLAANRWEALPRIRAALKSGRAVVADRYYHSNIVYGTAAGLDRRWLEGLDDGLPRPDLVIVLDIPPAESFRRKAAGRDRFESDMGLLKKVRFLYLHEAVGDRRHWAAVDASGSREEVHASVVRAAGPAVLKKHGVDLAPAPPPPSPFRPRKT